MAHLQKLLQQQDKGSGPAILSAFSQEVCALKHARFFIDIFLSQSVYKVQNLNKRTVNPRPSDLLMTLNQELTC